jgi:hypothetical protein
MTSARSIDSSEADIVTRLRREFAQSPGKALALSGGVLAALFVWVPRLFPATGESAPPAPEVVGDLAVLAPDGGMAPLSHTDSLSIRREFVAISEEAVRVRRFADPWKGQPSPRDPFARERPEPLQPEPPAASEATVPVATPLEDEIALESAAEAERAANLALQGIIAFGAKSRALIGGENVRVGDVVAGFRVESVAARSVTLRGEYGSYVRTLRDPLGQKEKNEEQNP